MKFQHSKFALNEKPKDFDYRSQSWNWYITKDVTIDEMAYFIGKGACWRNGQYDEQAQNFKKENIIGSRFIVLDFDKCDFLPHDVINKATELNIVPNMWYYSFSQGIKEGNNFRIVWVLDKLINHKQFEATIEKFILFFKKFNPDANTKDISRMWYPGNDGVEVINKQLHTWNDWNIEVPDKTEVLKKDDTVYEGRLGDTTRIGSIEVNGWIEELSRISPLFRKFLDGRYLVRGERLVLFNNLKYLNGSYELIEEIIKKYADIYRKFNSRVSYFEINKWWKDTTLKPKPIIEKGSIKYTVPEYFGNRAF